MNIYQRDLPLRPQTRNEHCHWCKTTDHLGFSIWWTDPESSQPSLLTFDCCSNAFAAFLRNYTYMYTASSSWPASLTGIEPRTILPIITHASDILHISSVKRMTNAKILWGEEMNLQLNQWLVDCVYIPGSQSVLGYVLLDSLLRGGVLSKMKSVKLTGQFFTAFVRR